MNNYDIGAVAAALFTAWLGPVLGPVLGIYSVIVIAAIVGAGFALARRDTSAKMPPALFVLLMVVATVIATVPLSLLAASYLSVLSAQVAAPVMALLIAAVGHDWERVAVWVWDQRLRFLPNRGANGGGQQP